MRQLQAQTRRRVWSRYTKKKPGFFGSLGKRVARSKLDGALEYSARGGPNVVLLLFNICISQGHYINVANDFA